MNLYGLSTKLFDVDGDVLFYSSTSEDGSETSRRASSTKTLDRGSYTSDTGYSASDRQWKLTVKDFNYDEEMNLKRLFRLHSRFFLSTVEGAFEVNAKSIRNSGSGLVLQFLTVGEA